MGEKQLSPYILREDAEAYYLKLEREIAELRETIKILKDENMEVFHLCQLVRNVEQKNKELKAWRELSIFCHSQNGCNECPKNCEIEVYAMSPAEALKQKEGK